MLHDMKNAVWISLILVLLNRGVGADDSSSSDIPRVRVKRQPQDPSMGPDGYGIMPGEDERRPGKCISLTVPECQKLGYNITYMPNQFHHENQMVAESNFKMYYQRAQACSTHILLYLCITHFPVCVENWSYKVKPCRSLCQAARSSCESSLQLMGMSWPQELACESLPQNDKCISKKKFLFGNSFPTNPDLNEHTQSKPIKNKDNRHICTSCSCKKPFQLDQRPPYNEVHTGGISGCLPACKSPTVRTDPDRTFATFWLGFWASLCALSTLTTVVTFLADAGRFHYPERPIVYLSACYLMVALGYLVRVGMGHDAVACAEDSSRLIVRATGPAQCSVVFLLTYLFGMAASVWWVVLTFTWFLAAGLKWGSEAIAKYSQSFHFVAWFFPGTQSLIVLTMSAIEGDPVGGLCYVGTTNMRNLKLFVITPLAVYLTLGTLFLIAGFVALFRIRHAIKLQGPGGFKTDKLEKLMVRIGIFGVLYTVPAAIVIACNAYEYVNRDKWDRHHNCPCVPLKDFTWESTNINKEMLLTARTYNMGGGEKNNVIIRTDVPPNPQPEYAIFMLKYFMSLVVGITSGFWIWSSKTLESWQNCFRSRSNTKPNAQMLPQNGVVFSANQNLINGVGTATNKSLVGMNVQDPLTGQWYNTAKGDPNAASAGPTTPWPIDHTNRLYQNSQTTPVGANSSTSGSTQLRMADSMNKYSSLSNV